MCQYYIIPIEIHEKALLIIPQTADYKKKIIFKSLLHNGFITPFEIKSKQIRVYDTVQIISLR